MAKLGVIKNYLKIKHDLQFGVIGCNKTNICYLPSKSVKDEPMCAVGFAEYVTIWNLKSQKIIERIKGRDYDSVTYLACHESIEGQCSVAVGFESGYVSLYSLWPMQKLLSIKCHKHAVSSIIFCGHDGDTVLCGSKDTDISAIDVAEEAGFRLKGHKSPITKLQYVSERDLLISGSQDGNIKLWFLATKYCFKTVFINSDLWDFVFVESVNLLITASSDPMIRLWQLSFKEESSEEFDLCADVVDRLGNTVQATFLGHVDRASNKRVVEMAVNKEKTFMAFNTGEKRLEIFKVMTEEDISKRLKKKMKKAKKLNTNVEEITITAEDRIKKHSDIYFPQHCKTMSMIYNTKNSALEMLTSMKNNTVAVMELRVDNLQLKVKHHISGAGHRTAVIYSEFTSDGQGLLTVSLSEAKLWNKPDFNCIFTIDWPRRKMSAAVEEEDIEYAQVEIEIAPGVKLEANTAILLPGDRHVVIGYKAGVLIMYSLVNGDMVQWMVAHRESVTSLILTSDKTKLLSSSTDKTVKVWSVEYGLLNSGAKSRLQLLDSGVSHEYKNGVSKISVSPDNKTLIVCTLDNKVQSYSMSNLKKRLVDFYKHSQPVSCVAIKSDCSEMLTGSGDKTVIRWSLQFGDCGIFKGHKEAVTDVKYLEGEGRREALSCDKSGLIMMINLKDMSEIMRLRGHGAQVTSLAVLGGGSSLEDGELELASVSVDCSVRLWYESEEIFSREVELEEERDRRYEEEELAREELVVVGAPLSTQTVGLLTKKTLATELAADELMEALENLRTLTAEPPGTADPKMAACGFNDPLIFVLFVLDKIRSGDLEFVLGQLPMKYVEDLFAIGAECLKKDRDVFLLVRCLWFLARIHFVTIITNPKVVPLLGQIADFSKVAVKNIVRSVGFCEEAFDYLSKDTGVFRFTESRKKLKPKSKKKSKSIIINE